MCPIFGWNNVPNASTVKRIIVKSAITDSVNNVKHTTRAGRCRSDQNIATMPQRFNGRRFNIVSKNCTLQQPLFSVFLLKICNSMRTKCPIDIISFVNRPCIPKKGHYWILEQHEMNADFADKLVFSDKALSLQLYHLYTKLWWTWDVALFGVNCGLEESLLCVSATTRECSNRE